MTMVVTDHNECRYCLQRHPGTRCSAEIKANPVNYAAPAPKPAKD